MVSRCTNSPRNSRILTKWTGLALSYSSRPSPIQRSPAPPDLARLKVELCRVLLTPALDVGLAAEALPGLGKLQDRIIVVDLRRLGLVGSAGVPPVAQEQLADLLVPHRPPPWPSTHERTLSRRGWGGRRIDHCLWQSGRLRLPPQAAPARRSAKDGRADAMARSAPSVRPHQVPRAMTPP